MKKSITKKDKKLMIDSGRLPEFVRMSRRPGIAKNYFDKNKKDIYSSDSIVLLTDSGVIGVKPPRYFDRLYDIENPKHLALLKTRRLAFMSRRDALIRSKTELPPWEYLQNAFRKKSISALALKRKLQKF